MALRFAPLAWLKLKLFCHGDDVEVGGFGISSEYDLLYVEDFVSVIQRVTSVTVALDDAAVADHFDRCADDGISPARCGRIWLHTHPGDSPAPSFTDEQTFARVFGTCDWAVMGILARGGRTYARLAFTAGPGGDVLLPVEVDWEAWPQLLLDREGAMDELFSAWMDEYGSNVRPDFTMLSPTKYPVLIGKEGVTRAASSLHYSDDPDDAFDQLVDREREDQAEHEVFAHHFENFWDHEEVWP